MSGRLRLLRRGDLLIDLFSHETRVGERAVTLTLTEYELLCLLASSPGRVFTREELLRRLWRGDYGEGDADGGRPPSASPVSEGRSRMPPMPSSRR